VRTDVTIVLYILPIVTVRVEALFSLLHYHYHCNIIIIIVIIIIKGATGIISESFRTNLSNIPGKHDIKELQKTAVVDSAYIFNILHFPCNCITYVNSKSTCCTLRLFVD
jgi:hypothetical protein